MQRGEGAIYESVHNLVFQNLLFGKFMGFLHEHLCQVLFPSVPGKFERKLRSTQTIQRDELFGVTDIFVCDGVTQGSTLVKPNHCASWPINFM